MASSSPNLPSKARTCQQCGMVLDDPAEFHPYMFCVLKKAGRDPWEDFRWASKQLGHSLPTKPPLVRNIRNMAALREDS